MASQGRPREFPASPSQSLCQLKPLFDAESTRTYSQAYSKNPRFYKLLRTLEAYKKVLDDKTTAILSSDSELLKVMTRGQGGAQ